MQVKKRATSFPRSVTCKLFETQWHIIWKQNEKNELNNFN